MVDHEKILIISDARKERDLLAAQIADLCASFERRVKGVRIMSVSLSRPSKADHRGVKTESLKCTLLVQLKEDSGFGSDL
jgi:hypothetical protein